MKKSLLLFFCLLSLAFMAKAQSDVFHQVPYWEDFEGYADWDVEDGDADSITWELENFSNLAYSGRYYVCSYNSVATVDSNVLQTSWIVFPDDGNEHYCQWMIGTMSYYDDDTQYVKLCYQVYGSSEWHEIGTLQVATGYNFRKLDVSKSALDKLNASGGDTLRFSFVHYGGKYEDACVLLDAFNAFSQATTCSTPVITEYPYIMDFEGGLACYDTVTKSTSISGWHLPPADVFIGYNSAYALMSFGSNFDNNPDSWLISPKFDLSSIPVGDPVKFSWYDAMAVSEELFNKESYDVYVLEVDPSFEGTVDTNMFRSSATKVFATNELNFDYTQHVVDLSAYAGKRIVFAFYHHGNSEWGSAIFLDNIELQSYSKLVLHSNDGLDTKDTLIVWKDSLFALPDAMFSRPGYAFYGWLQSEELMPFDYLLYPGDVVTVSGEEHIYAIWRPIDTIDTFPYMMDFDDGLDSWYTRDEDRYGGNWKMYDDSTGNVFLMSASEQVDVEMNNWLISPAIHVPVADSFYATFKVRTYGGTYLVTYISTTDDSLHHFAMVGVDEMNHPNEVTYHLNLTSYMGQTIYLALIHLDEPYNYSRLYLDSISFKYYCKPREANISHSACADSYDWGSRHLTSSGVYDSIIHINEVCDSVTHLTLALAPIASNTVDTAKCDSLTLNNITYYANASVDSAIHRPGMCDSIVHYNLKVNPSYTAAVKDTSSCDSIKFKGVKYTAALSLDTIFNHTVAGCDSIMPYRLHVNQSYLVEKDSLGCDSVLFNTVYYKVHRNDTVRKKSVYQCDSISVFHLIVNSSYLDTVKYEDPVSYEWEGETYTASGYYSNAYKHYKNNKGCDSVRVLELWINGVRPDACPTYRSDIYDTACAPLAWGNYTFTTTGTLDSVFHSVAGCDSIVTMHAFIGHPYNIPIDSAVCDSIVWAGQTYKTSNTYTLNDKSIFHCDSITTLNLTVHPSYSRHIDTSACDSLLWQDKYYKNDFVNKRFADSSIYKCDSSTFITLSVYPTVVVNIDTQACHVVVWDGHNYYENTNLRVDDSTVNKCDSFTYVHIRVLEPSYGTADSSACDSVLWQDTWYKMDVAHTVTKVNMHGCDSFVTVNLHVKHTLRSSAIDTSCDSYTWNAHRYTSSGDYYDTIDGSNGCDSIAHLHLVVNKSKQQLISDVACDSFAWNGITYTSSQSPVYRGKTSQGCDSVVNLKLTVYYSFVDTISRSAADTFHWENADYVMSGYYSNIHRGYATVNGCDSVIILHLTLSNGVSINDIDNVSFSLYPNPTSSMVTVEADGAEVQRLEAIDLSGRTLKVVEGVKVIDLSACPQGLYMLRITTNRGVSIHRIVRR